MTKIIIKKHTLAKTAVLIGLLFFSGRAIAIVLLNSGYDIGRFLWADDSFYYLVIAQNLAAGDGSTFDGISATNGYHPLWQAMTVPWFWVFSAGSDQAVQAIYLFQVALIGGAAWLIFEGLRRYDDLSAGVTTLMFLASPLTAKILLNGMESAVAFTLAASLLYFSLKDPTSVFTAPKNGRLFLLRFGLLAGLAFARLEAGLLVALYLTLALHRTVVRKRALNWLFVLAFSLFVLGALYVALNYWVVGYPVPISGVVKESWVPSAEVTSNVTWFHIRSAAALFLVEHSIGSFAPVFLVAQLLGLVAFVRLPRGRAFLYGALPLLAFGLSFMALSILKFSGGFYWYGWPALLVSIISTFALLSTLRHHLIQGALIKPAFTLFLAAWICLVAARVVRDVTKETNILYDWSIDATLMDQTIDFIDQKIPGDEGIAGHSVGLLSYATGRPIMQTEGLVNDKAYLKALRKEMAYETLYERGARWLIINSTDATDAKQRLQDLLPDCVIRDVTVLLPTAAYGGAEMIPPVDELPRVTIVEFGHCLR